MRTILRAYLAELHAVSNSKNQLRSLFFQPNSFSFSNSTKDLLKKKWSGPKSMDLVEYLKWCSTTLEEKLPATITN
jgi:hypothetical protein